MSERAYIGTSGWAYKHWKDNWYKGVPAKRWLEHCAARFTGLEANGTFYRLTKKETFEDWVRRTPDDLRFTMKAHRYLTHRKRLKDISEGIQKQKEPAEGFGDKLACVVWQLASNFKADRERLESFLEELKAWPETRHVIEFRHDSWYTDETAKLLELSAVAVCISDAAGWPRWDRVTTDLAYVRFHGHRHTYWNEYTEEDLRPWADKMESWLKNGCEVHGYFDNDAKGDAPEDALKLMRMLGIAKVPAELPEAA